MIKALFLDREQKDIDHLTEHCKTYCPQVKVNGIASTKENAYRYIENLSPELLIIDIGLACSDHFNLFDQTDSTFETILMCSSNSPDAKSYRLSITGYLFKPVNIQDLLLSVSHAVNIIRIRQNLENQQRILNQLLHQLPPYNLIRVPTMEGFEFLKTEDIIRCEGLNKYTLIFNKEEGQIISSYNIGEFRKMLQPHGFFATHKSHLVNLRYIRKFTNEGIITMQDGSRVPVSRRRKSTFSKKMSQIVF